ncbi:Competence protein A [Caulifigura coniformis]|uniref:Competence protein A n=1 Tax=Caulifigura coniformis TaxID=2527983 RepID=A0A517SAJ1_9PLAN|nr:type IV pilus assembly protein PilM [Caulifigura coniformis]QDT53133.1 Competence protein A [Caulifigura coniformis]
MAQKRAAWGIDIGQSSFKAIKLQYSEATDQVVAAAFDYIQYPKILSQPDAIPEEIVADAMKTFLSRNEVADDLIAISVPGHSSLARFIQLPPVESSRLAEIVKYEARQQIPFALEEVIWDFQPLGSGVEESGYLLDAEVGLFAMKRDQVNNAMRPFINNKLEIELVQTAPLALYNVLSFDELGIKRGEAVHPRDEYTIVLDMGCDNTTLMISNGPKIWIRNIPVGGNHFTRALTKEMKLSFAKAEHLKCNATKSPDPRAVFQALRPVFNDYVSEIQRSIGFFSSVNRQAKVNKVVGLGNGFKLAGLQKFLQQNLQYEVEKPDGFKSLAGDSVVNSALFVDNVLSFAVPYGLALQALEVTRIRTTLLPPEIATARMVRRKKPWAVLTAAGVLVGASVAMVGNSLSYGVVNSPYFTEAEGKAKTFGDTVSSAVTAYDGEKGTFAGAKKTIEELVVGRRSMDWMELFNAINDCLPYDDNPAAKPIPLRDVVSVTHVSCKKEPDVSTWFTKATGPGMETPRQTMLPADLAAPPSGTGFVVTVHGMHWHHDPNDPLGKDVLYLRRTFLANLQKAMLERSGFTRDVGRMGISHATVVAFEEQRELVPKPGVKKITRQGRIDLSTAAPQGAAPGAVNPGFGGTAMPEGDAYAGQPGDAMGAEMPFGGAAGSIAGQLSGGTPGAIPLQPGQEVPPEYNEDEYDLLHKTVFQIQFIYRPIPKGPERDKPREEAPASDAASEVDSGEAV